MKIKRGLFFTFILVSIVFASFVCAQTPDETGTGTTNEPSQNPALPPGIPTAGGGLLGDFNPDTGKPRNLETFQKYGDYYQDREQNKSFLLQEWTNLLANNQYLGPFFFYTDMFFAFFNPLWTIVFGVEFSWSWAFFLSFGIWIFFIFLVYYPMQGVLGNQAIDLFIAMIIASLIGVSGAIKKVVEFFSIFTTNIFVLFVIVVLMILILFFYRQLFKGLVKESKKIELEESEENIRTFGKVTRRSFKDS